MNTPIKLTKEQAYELLYALKTQESDRLLIMCKGYDSINSPDKYTAIYWHDDVNTFDDLSGLYDFQLWFQGK